MKRSILVVVGLVLGSSVACAEPSSEVAFDVETTALLAAADSANGEALAKAGKCRKCHGDAGVSDDPEDANIAGMRASYIYKQLKDYQAGNRSDRDMKKATTDLNDQQIADLSVWFESLTPVSANGGNADAAVLELVYHGDPSRLVKSCASCHGRDGRGGQYDHPAIAGQNRDYFVYTMSEFKEGDRENDVYSRMRLIAGALSDEEVEALAAYYAAPVSGEAAE